MNATVLHYPTKRSDQLCFQIRVNNAAADAHATLALMKLRQLKTNKEKQA